MSVRQPKEFLPFLLRCSIFRQVLIPGVRFNLSCRRRWSKVVHDAVPSGVDCYSCSISSNHLSSSMLSSAITNTDVSCTRLYSRRKKGPEMVSRALKKGNWSSLSFWRCLTSHPRCFFSSEMWRVEGIYIVVGLSLWSWDSPPLVLELLRLPWEAAQTCDPEIVFSGCLRALGSNEMHSFWLINMCIQNYPTASLLIESMGSQLWLQSHCISLIYFKLEMEDPVRGNFITAKRSLVSEN